MSETTEVKHTPGPWMVFVERPEYLGYTVFHVATPTRPAIALGPEYWPDGVAPTIDKSGHNQPDEHADIDPSHVAEARLIASAPDLLDSLERVLAFAVEANNRCPRPKTAEDMAAGFGCNPYSIKVLKDARAVIAKATGRP